MISDTEQAYIDRIEYEDDLEKISDIAGRSRNPYFLQQYAISYNWDNGVGLPTVIANNKYCDLGTALTLFWLAEGMCYYLGEVQKNEYNIEWANLCQLLIDKLLAGDYLAGPVSFKPSVSKVAAFNYKKAGVPSILYSEVKGAGI